MERLIKLSQDKATLNEIKEFAKKLNCFFIFSILIPIANKEIGEAFLVDE